MPTILHDALSMLTRHERWLLTGGSIRTPAGLASGRSV
jgi:hypothetical protein